VQHESLWQPHESTPVSLPHQRASEIETRNSGKLEESQGDNDQRTEWHCVYGAIRYYDQAPEGVQKQRDFVNLPIFSDASGEYTRTLGHVRLRRSGLNPMLVKITGF
jgi:hypothetical protein